MGEAMKQPKTYDDVKLDMVALLVAVEMRHWDGTLEDCVWEYSNEYGVKYQSLLAVVDEMEGQDNG